MVQGKADLPSRQTKSTQAAIQKPGTWKQKQCAETLQLTQCLMKSQLTQR